MANIETYVEHMPQRVGWEAHVPKNSTSVVARTLCQDRLTMCRTLCQDRITVCHSPITSSLVPQSRGQVGLWTC